MKKRLCILLGFIILILSGCVDKEEPKQLAVVNSIIYDIQSDGLYHVTAEIMNPSAGVSGEKRAGGGGNESPNITVTGEGESLREALSNLTKSMEKTIFGGHNKVRFFTQRMASTDMLSAMEYFSRDQLTDETPLIVVIKDELPENIHFSSIGLSDLVGQYFEDLSQHQHKQASKSVFVTMLDFVKDYYADGKQPVAGVAELAKTECKTSQTGNNGQNAQAGQDAQNNNGTSGQLILYEGLAAFKDGKLVGYLDGDGARAYNMLTNNIGSSYVSVPSGIKKTVFKIDGSKADIETSVQGDRVSVEIKIKADLQIVEESGGIDVSKPDGLSAIEENFNKLIQTQITTTVHKAQISFKSDIFGFGQYVHQQHPDKWKEIKERWDDGYFSKAEIHVTVTSAVYRSGQIKKPLEMGD